MKTNNEALLNTGMDQVKKYDPELAEQMLNSAWVVNFVETGYESCVMDLGLMDALSMLSELNHSLAVTDSITRVSFFSVENVKDDAEHEEIDIPLVYAQTLVHEFVHFNGQCEPPAYMAGINFAAKSGIGKLKSYTAKIAIIYAKKVLSGKSGKCSHQS